MKTKTEIFNKCMLDSIKQIIKQTEANKNSPTEIVSAIIYQISSGMEDETNKQEAEAIYNLIIQRYSRLIEAADINRSNLN